MTRKTLVSPHAVFLTIALIILTMAAGLPPVTAAPKAALKLPLFQNNDTVLFTCDNINSLNGNYYQYISLFWLTRHPQLHIRFINGSFTEFYDDTIINRLDEDVAFWNPTYVVIMLGMNELGSRLYKPDLPSEERDLWRQQQIDAWKKEMTDLVTKIETLLPRDLVLTSPTVYNAVTLGQLPSWARQGVDTDLSRIRDFPREIANERQHPYLDWRTLMQEITQREQLRDRKFSFAPERNRSNSAGELVMAYIFLRAQEVTAYRAEIMLDLVAEQPIKLQKGIEIKDLVNTGDAVSFKYLAEALPFMLPPNLKKSYQKILDSVIDLEGHERLLVLGLTSPLYRLLIDGKDCGRFTGADLSRGIDFTAIAETPVVQQVQEVVKLNYRRVAMESQTVRYWIDGKVQLKNLRRLAQEQNAEFPDDDAAAARLMIEREKEPALKEFWSKVAVLSLPENLEKWQNDLRSLEEEIYRVNQPVEHSVIIEAMK